jgi:hypothetical protein
VGIYEWLSTGSVARRQTGALVPRDEGGIPKEVSNRTHMSTYGSTQVI